MAAFGIHRLVPPSLLARRWIVVLVAYLDDSGKDPQNRVTTVAGYVAKDTAWAAFEAEVEPIFAKYGIKVLHAKDLAATKGEFAGWTVLQKESFVAQICIVLARHATLGVSMSAVKEVYDRRAKESTHRKKTSRPYTFCMNVIIDWILRDIRTGRIAWDEGVALIVEAGHENNPEAEENFHKVIKLHNLASVLRSITFVPKENSRAIQVADLIAFYSRRDSNAFEKSVREGKDHKPEQMIKIITERGAFRGFVATDFERQQPSGKPLSPLDLFHLPRRFGRPQGSAWTAPDRPASSVPALDIPLPRIMVDGSGAIRFEPAQPRKQYSPPRSAEKIGSSVLRTGPQRSKEHSLATRQAVPAREQSDGRQSLGPIRPLPGKLVSCDLTKGRWSS